MFRFLATRNERFLHAHERVCSSFRRFVSLTPAKKLGTLADADSCLNPSVDPAFLAFRRSDMATARFPQPGVLHAS